MSQCILVVDDDRDVRELICRMLEQDGYRVVPANGGYEALEQLTGLNPDLVITDVVMPDMDGFEVLLQLRRLAPNALALVISGGGRLAPDLYLETARKLGARAVLRKPFTRAEILDVVHKVLGPVPPPATHRQEPF